MYMKQSSTVTWHWSERRLLHAFLQVLLDEKLAAAGNALNPAGQPAP
jgi:hypothetical protein